MVATLRVDVREAALWAALQERAHADVALERGPLDLADAWIVGDGGTLLFERKTVADLAASLKDGRFREQKARMASHHAARAVTYVVEGATLRWLLQEGGASHGLSTAVYQGMVFGTLYRDGMHVVLTKDVAETAAFLTAVARKVAADPAKYAVGGGAPAGPDVVALQGLKRCKLANITPAACYRMQLCQIPHVSTKLADAIAAAYPTLPALVTALDPLAPAARVAALTRLSGVGAKKAEAVLSMLWPAEDADRPEETDRREDADRPEETDRREAGASS